MTVELWPFQAALRTASLISQTQVILVRAGGATCGFLFQAALRRLLDDVALPANAYRGKQPLSR